MNSRVMQVFYGTDLLPYKDKERKVHYPITGNSFCGSNKINHIHFYVDQIGGTSNVTWVIVSKLPNGKLGYEILSTIDYDEDNVPYLDFNMSAYYTSVKGDLFLALRGYEGEVTFTETEEGIYQISGDPLIEVTGTIKFAINYAPMLNTGTQVLPSDVDTLILALNGYIKNHDGIVVLETTSDDIDKYSNGQIFFIKATTKFYELVSGTLTEIELSLSELNVDELNAGTINVSEDINIDSFNDIKNGSNEKLIDYLQTHLNYLKKYDYVTYHITTTTTLQELYTIIGLQPALIQVLTPYYLCHIYFKTGSIFNVQVLDLSTGDRYFGEIAGTDFGNITIGGFINKSGSYYKPWATKEYVENALADFLQREYDKVDITTYPTLNDFLASTGEEGYIYLYPIDTSDESKGYYQYIWENSAWVSLGSTQIDLSGYLQKTTSANKVYGTNELGAQTLYTVDDFYEGNIARRDSDGSITVPLTPTQNGHASSKKYVDDEISDLSNEVDDKLEEKANVDGNYPTLTAGLADNFTPYSEDSGAEQENPFISNGTGTNNNTEIVTVGDYGLLKEKQGNTLVVNQGARPLTSGYWGASGGSATFSDNVATFTPTTQYGSLTQNVNLISGHTYLLKGKVKLPRANYSSSLGVGTSDLYYAEGLNINLGSTISDTNWHEVSKIATYTKTGSQSQKIIFVNGEASDLDAMQITDVVLIDITQMFNGDIPQDLLDNPSHFSWYYNGSLTYNTGTLVNANGVKLVSTGRNIWDEVAKLGKTVDSATGQEESVSGVFCSDFIRVVPNSNYYFKVGGSGDYVSGFRVACYDINKNYLGIGSGWFAPANMHITLPINCAYIRFKTTGSTYNNDITISLYYTPAQGGEGYDKYYKYEEPYVVDTGNEVLRKAGSVCDYKEPNGTIHRLVDTLVVDGTNNTNMSVATGTGGVRFTVDISNALAPTSSSSLPSLVSILKKVSFDTISSEQLTENCVALYSSSRITFYIVGKTTLAEYQAYFQSNPLTVYYELATPTTEQGTPFAENLPINDYGMLYWLDSSNNLVGIPQGAKIFFPTNYKGFVDDMYSRVDGDSSDYALNSELNAKFETYLKSLSGYDATKTQTLKNVNGTFTWVDDE